jgi:oligopeptide/dipeptide ABC transporter ATP-binding protein
MQMIFQDPRSSLNPRMRVSSLVGEPIAIHEPSLDSGRRGERVVELLELVRLEPRVGECFPHELSGGQRQRVAIARALACGPELVVADEPTSALDVSVQAQIVNLLMELQKKRSLAFLFISHNLKLVEVFCHRMAVMYLGGIVEHGPSKQVCASPIHPYTEALLAALPAARGGGGPRVLEGEVPSPIDRPKGCVFHPRCPVTPKVEACTERVPALKEVTPGRLVACHLASRRLGS